MRVNDRGFLGGDENVLRLMQCWLHYFIILKKITELHTLWVNYISVMISINTLPSVGHCPQALKQVFAPLCH
jgi:hypothetical protein